MNNVFFLEAAMKGRYPKAFEGEPLYELMGFKPGDEKIMHAPLDWASITTHAASFPTRVTCKPSEVEVSAGPKLKPIRRRGAIPTRDGVA